MPASADPEIRRLVPLVALYTRHHGADAPATLNARRDLAVAQLEARIRRDRDLLTPDQRARLALLLEARP